MKLYLSIKTFFRCFQSSEKKQKEVNPWFSLSDGLSVRTVKYTQIVVSPEDLSPDLCPSHESLYRLIQSKKILQGRVRLGIIRERRLGDILYFRYKVLNPEC